MTLFSDVYPRPFSLCFFFTVCVFFLQSVSTLASSAVLEDLKAVGFSLGAARGGESELPK